MEFLEVVEIFDIVDEDMCCECLIKAGVMASRRLFSNVWKVLIGKIVALILDMVLVVTAINSNGSGNAAARNTFTCFYICYQRNTALLICGCFRTWSQSRKRSILGWDEEELENQIGTSGQAKKKTTTTESPQSPSNGIELKIAQSPPTGPVLPPAAASQAASTVPTAVKDPSAASAAPGASEVAASNKDASTGADLEAGASTEKVGKIGGELDVSPEEKKQLENNLYWGAHFVGIDLFSKLVVKRVTDGDCSKMDCCYAIIYLILLLGDVALWFVVATAFAFNFNHEFGVWIGLMNVLIAGFIGHLQHYIIIFIAPVKKSNLTNRCGCCKWFNYFWFAILVLIQVVIIFIVLIECISKL